MSDTVTFPFDHPVTVTLIDKATGDVLDVSDTTAEALGAHYTLTCIMWNALAISGGVRWRHPSTGDLYPRGISFSVTAVHPETGELVGIDWR